LFFIYNKEFIQKKYKDSILYPKNDIDSSESVGAKSETPNHAFAPEGAINESALNKYEWLLFT
jgi:hypothetical protein